MFSGPDCAKSSIPRPGRASGSPRQKLDSGRICLRYGLGGAAAAAVAEGEDVGEALEDEAEAAAVLDEVAEAAAAAATAAGGLRGFGGTTGQGI